MSLLSTAAGWLVRRKVREIMAQAAPGGIMSESLKASLKKAGKSVATTVGAAALLALGAWLQNPVNTQDVLAVVPAAAPFVLLLIQGLATLIMDQVKHRA